MKKQGTFRIDDQYDLVIDGDAVNVITKAKNKPRVLAQYMKGEYLAVSMYDKGRRVHSIVASVFLGERPKDKVVNHKDGNKVNNVPENLEYITNTENIHHAIAMGLHVSCYPERMPRGRGQHK